MSKRRSFSQSMRDERMRGRSFWSSLWTSSWNSLGSWLGTYDGVDPRNTTMRGVIARPTSAADLTVATPYMRNLCRNYERNNPTVRAAVEALVANVIGTGIALEPDTGNPDIDERLRGAWSDYIRDCFIDRTGLYEGQSQAFRDVVVAGESLWRFVIDSDRSKDGRIPLCILPLEAEWLGDNGQTVVGQDQGYVGGVKLDQFGRPRAYSIRSPSGTIEDVPADMVIQCFEKRRALQIRGEPWFAPILTTLRQEKDLVMAELEAAKNTAGYAAAITTNGGIPPDLDEKGEKVRDIAVGSVLELQTGEDIKLLSHTRPSQQIKPFREMLRGDECAALRLGRRWLDRDVSSANYSSMRADMLDNERLMAPVREWTGRHLAGKVYQKVLPYLCIQLGIPLQRGTYRLVAEGQPYVDPEKDARAAALSIAYGLSTYEVEIGKRGGDWRQVWAKLAEEKKLAESLGLELKDPDGKAMEHEVATPLDKAGANGAGRPVDGERAMMEMLREIRSPLTIHNHIPEAKPEVKVENTFRADIPQPQQIVVQASAPAVNVENNIRTEAAPVQQIVVQAAAPSVHVDAPDVTVNNDVRVQPSKVVARRNNDGTVTMTTVE